MVYSRYGGRGGFTNCGRTILHRNIGIALDNTGGNIIGAVRIHITLTAAIDIAVYSTALDSSTFFGLADGTARNRYDGIGGHRTQFTAAIDTALDGTARDVHRGLLGCSELVPLRV